MSKKKLSKEVHRVMPHTLGMMAATPGKPGSGDPSEGTTCTISPARAWICARSIFHSGTTGARISRMARVIAYDHQPATA